MMKATRRRAAPRQTRRATRGRRVATSGQPWGRTVPVTYVRRVARRSEEEDRPDTGEDDRRAADQNRTTQPRRRGPSPSRLDGRVADRRDHDRARRRGIARCGVLRHRQRDGIDVGRAGECRDQVQAARAGGACTSLTTSSTRANSAANLIAEVRLNGFASGTSCLTAVSPRAGTTRQTRRRRPPSPGRGSTCRQQRPVDDQHLEHAHAHHAPGDQDAAGEGRAGLAGRGSRLCRANHSVTAVDDTRPPVRPVSASPGACRARGSRRNRPDPVPRSAAPAPTATAGSARPRVDRSFGQQRQHDERRTAAAPGVEVLAESRDERARAACRRAPRRSDADAAASSRWSCIVSAPSSQSRGREFGGEAHRVRLPCRTS